MRSDVSRDIVLVGIAKQAIEEYYVITGTLPINNNQVGLEQYFSFGPGGLNLKILISARWLAAGEPAIVLIYNTEKVPELDGWETLAYYAEIKTVVRCGAASWVAVCPTGTALPIAAGKFRSATGSRQWLPPILPTN